MLFKLVVISICLAVYVAGLTTFGQISANNNRRTTKYHSGLVSSTTESASGQENEDETDNELPPVNMLRMLHQIQDRLTMMSAVNEQKNRRLETLEDRLTKLEVQIQEKSDRLRTDLKEESR